MRCRWELRIISLILMLTLVSLPVFADTVTTDEKGRRLVQVFDDRKTGSIRLSYQDEEADGNGPVKGAEFTYYRVAKISSSVSGTPQTVSTQFVPFLRNSLNEYIKIDKDTNAVTIQKDVVAAYKDQTPADGVVYTAVTDETGVSITQNMAPGVYLAVETKAAKSHLPSAPFLFTIPYMVEQNNRSVGWCYEATAEPKSIPCGDLVVKKTVKGNAGNKKKEFTFTVTFDPEGVFHYTKNKGDEGTIESGGTFKLKSGDEFVIDTIPAGTKYKVEEKEANKSGYKTTVDGNASGKIPKLKKATVHFTNSKSKSNKTGTGNGNGSGSGNASLSNVRTGDFHNPVLWCSVFALIALVIGYVIYKRREQA